MTSLKIPLEVVLDQPIYQALHQLAQSKNQTTNTLVEEAISQYIADQSLDGSGWSSVFERLVSDNHNHMHNSPNLKAAEIIAKKEELKRKKRLGHQ